MRFNHLATVLSGAALALCTACAHTPSSSSRYDYEVLRDQVYASRPDGDLRGDLYLPASDRPMPGVVMIHGGGWRNGEASDMRRFAWRVAEAGFVVFNINYRLAPDHKFPAQLEDARAAVRWLKTNAARLHLDPDRIGSWGYSAGAHLAMLLGTVGDDALPDAKPSEPSSRVSAVVAGAGPTDLRKYPDNHYVADLMPEDAGPELFRLGSPVAMVSPDDAPTFLYHGERDMIVGFSNSADMHRALQSAGVETSLYKRSTGHILTYFFGGRAVEEGVAFLKKRLSSGDQPIEEPAATENVSVR